MTAPGRRHTNEGHKPSTSLVLRHYLADFEFRMVSVINTRMILVSKYEISNSLLCVIR
jgi:hypothetical protein